MAVENILFNVNSFLDCIKQSELQRTKTCQELPKALIHLAERRNLHLQGHNMPEKIKNQKTLKES